MDQGPLRWLLDVGLPRAAYKVIDAVAVEDFQRVPGPAGIREAVTLDRTLVTCNQDFRGPSDLRLDHPGVVVFEDGLVDRSEVERNLLHLAFRIARGDQPITLRGNRFLLRPDRAILLIMPNGSEVDVEPWRQVSLAPMPAVLSGAAS